MCILFQQTRLSQPSPMVSTATPVASASPYPHPSQLAQLQASHQGTPLILPQQPQSTAASAVSINQIPFGSLINPGKPSSLGNGLDNPSGGVMLDTAYLKPKFIVLTSFQ